MSVRHHVEVRDTQVGDVGRGLFALRDFAPGDLVLSLDRPLVAEVEEEHMLDTCAWCLHRSEQDPAARCQSAAMLLPMGFVDVKACTGCRRVAYCSKACQTRAWKREHKFECKVLAPASRPNLPHGVRAVIKLLGRMQAEQDKSGPALRDILNFRPAASKESMAFITSRNKQRFDDFMLLANAAWQYAGKPTFDQTDPEGIAKAFMFNIMSNWFGISSPIDDTQLAKGFDPLLCSTNHSCDPNVQLVCNQPVTLLRALKPIKKGEEVLMSYITASNPFSVRNAELKETYCFNCQCAKCKKGATAREDAFRKKPEDLPREFHAGADALVQRHEELLAQYFVPSVDETAQKRVAAMQAEAFVVAEDKAADGEQIKKTLQMCISSGLWSWDRQPVPSLLRSLFGAYLAVGESYRALRLGLKLHFEIQPVLHPQPFASERLIDLWALSVTCNVLCGPSHQEIRDELVKSGVNLQAAYFGFFLELHDRLPLMYGVESPFGQVVENTYRQIMEHMGRSESQLKQDAKEAMPALEALGRSVSVDTL